MLKIGFAMVEQHCMRTTQPAGMEIVGYYVSHPCPKELSAAAMELSAPTKSIADKLAQNFPGATVWVLDASKIAESKVALVGHSQTKDDWRPFAPNTVNVSDETLKQTAKLISDMKYIDIVDFDDHFGDISENFLNPDLLKGHPIDTLPAVACEDE